MCVCGKAVHQLYGPLYDPREPNGRPPFACRCCYGLVYRRKTDNDAFVDYVQSKAGPAMAAYAALPLRVRHRPRRHYVEQPPARLAAELAGERPLSPQELRL